MSLINHESDMTPSTLMFQFALPAGVLAIFIVTLPGPVLVALGLACIYLFVL